MGGLVDLIAETTSMLWWRWRVWWNQFANEKEGMVTDAEAEQETLDWIAEEEAQELFETSDDLLDDISAAAEWEGVSVFRMLWEIFKRWFWRRFDRGYE